MTRQVSSAGRSAGMPRCSRSRHSSRKPMPTRPGVEEIRPLADMDAFWRQYRGFDAQIRSPATRQSDPDRLSMLKR